MSGGAGGEQRAPWKHDSEAAACDRCKQPFNVFRRRHHCRRCGGIFCDECCSERVSGISGYGEGKHRICKICKGTTALCGGLKPARVRERKICVVGVHGVGKTALVTQYIDHIFAEDTGPGGAAMASNPPAEADGAAGAAAPPSATTRSKTVRCRGSDYLLSILDATAQATGEVFQPVHSIGTCAYLVVFALDDRASFAAARALRERILDCGGFDVPLVLVANKDDRPGRTVTPEEVTQLAAEWRTTAVEISAARSGDVDALFDGVLREVVARELQ